MYLLPFASSAAQLGTAAVQSVTESLSASGEAFAKMLAGQEAEKAKEIEEGLKDGDSADSMLALIDQIQAGLQAKLQAMGMQLDGELTMSIDADGKVNVEGDSDAAVALEQIINSDPKLQAKMGKLKRACEEAGNSATADRKLKYFAGQLQLEGAEPDIATEAAAEEATAVAA